MKFKFLRLPARSFIHPASSPEKPCIIGPWAPTNIQITISILYSLFSQMSCRENLKTQIKLPRGGLYCVRYGHSLTINPSPGMYHELHPFSAMDKWTVLKTTLPWQWWECVICSLSKVKLGTKSSNVFPFGRCSAQAARYIPTLHNPALALPPPCPALPTIRSTICAFIKSLHSESTVKIQGIPQLETNTNYVQMLISKVF